MLQSPVRLNKKKKKNKKGRRPRNVLSLRKIFLEQNSLNKIRAKKTQFYIHGANGASERLYILPARLSISRGNAPEKSYYGKKKPPVHEKISRVKLLQEIVFW